MAKQRKKRFKGQRELVVYPSWSHLYQDEAALRRELVTIEFRGPGAYLTNEETLLIIAVPLPREEDIKMYEENMWRKGWPKGTAFRVFVWGCNVNDTLMSRVVPTKQDDRKF